VIYGSINILFIHGSFNSTVSNSDYVARQGRGEGGSVKDLDRKRRKGTAEWETGVIRPHTGLQKKTE
jgi:hypothetical protein